VVIELHVSQLAREHCSVDAVQSVVPKFAAYTEPKLPGKQPWPVIDYDPVQFYLRELRVGPAIICDSINVDDMEKNNFLNLFQFW